MKESIMVNKKSISRKKMLLLMKLFAVASTVSTASMGMPSGRGAENANGPDPQTGAVRRTPTVRDPQDSTQALPGSAGIQLNMPKGEAETLADVTPEIKALLATLNTLAQSIITQNQPHLHDGQIPAAVGNIQNVFHAFHPDVQTKPYPEAKAYLLEHARRLDTLTGNIGFNPPEPGASNHQTYFGLVTTRFNYQEGLTPQTQTLLPMALYYAEMNRDATQRFIKSLQTSATDSAVYNNLFCWLVNNLNQEKEGNLPGNNANVVTNSEQENIEFATAVSASTSDSQLAEQDDLAIATAMALSASTSHSQPVDEDLELVKTLSLIEAETREQEQEALAATLEASLQISTLTRTQGPVEGAAAAGQAGTSTSYTTSDEALARLLQEQEDQRIAEASVAEGDTTSDEALARQLQEGENKKEEKLKQDAALALWLSQND
jgi:hypothetical protein